MNSWGHGIIEVGQEDIHELEGCDIVAFQFAEAGAMGYHAGVFFVTAECKVYFTCYMEPSAYSGMHRFMPWESLEKIFPPLKEFDHSIADINVVVPNGWKYRYLGAGNHLLIKQSIWKQFQDEALTLGKGHPETILYNLWLDAVLETLKCA